MMKKYNKERRTRDTEKRSKEEKMNNEGRERKNIS